MKFTIEVSGDVVERQELLNGAQNCTPLDLARLLFPSETLSRMDGREVRWHCPCSHERVVDALATLGHAEVKSILEEQGKAEATCDFCRSTYVVSSAELTTLLSSLSSAKAPVS